jgi:hypothetical protein
MGVRRRKKDDRRGHQQLTGGLRSTFLALPHGYRLRALA